MKQFLYIVVFLTGSLLFAQETFTANFDYEVSYEIPNGMKGKDTLTIAFDKTGRYVWTDFKKLFDRFSIMLPQENNLMTKDMVLDVIYDSKTTKVYMNLNSDNFSFFIKMNLTAFLPGRVNPAPFKESFSLLSEKSEDKATLLNKEYPVYKVYPDNLPEEKNKISLVFAEEYPIDNDELLRALFDLMIDDENDGKITTNFPKGVILQLSGSGPQNEVILKAISIKKISRTITINNTLEIKE
ncbi:hypothetical protein C8N46_108106 [Kordia periserrulae]|uniref:GLPGLI family protein n=1 Tax=Kordia periserrulae TaxID=701523 RepID=A0A2T6BUS4_9FLAO|nr:hypothetical protein [Kordia periserrulae]PTX59796.1 hypothetical protein C8N46_108106 [Kordia periserrulae]